MNELDRKTKTTMMALNRKSIILTFVKTLLFGKKIK